MYMNLYSYLRACPELDERGMSKEWLMSLDGAKVKEVAGREENPFGKIFKLHYCERGSSGFRAGLYVHDCFSGSRCSCGIDSEKSYVLAQYQYCEIESGARKLEIVSLASGSLPNLEALKKKKRSKVRTAKVDEKIDGRNLFISKKKEFFKDFQIGVEVEGEYFLNRIDVEGESNGYFSEEEETLKGDGSLSGGNGGHTMELVTPIIRSFTEEKEFIDALTAISVPVKDYGKVFAYHNTTAGTHIHLDFSDDFRKNFEKKFGMEYDDDFLRLFDSVEFEKLFFRRYFETFRLKKFWDRLQNTYCKSFLTATDDRIVDDSWSVIERQKAGSGRYKWLNYECLGEGEGIEFRIFPHLQTAKGMTKVISFTQRVLMEYLAKHGTKENFAIIRDFYRTKPFDYLKLSDRDRVIYEAFRIDNILRYTSSGSSARPSFDVMKFVSTIKKKK